MPKNAHDSMHVHTTAGLTGAIGERYVISFIGLPARGKSYTSRAIVHFFTFLGCPVRLFNAGNKRRTRGLAGAAASFCANSSAPAPGMQQSSSMAFFTEIGRAHV